ncbi:hypothetical protein MKW94_020575 [Papaver nudicaule]|uniref:Uncharacterized protein n=1 Tax=Papaver nudicaule TaxID=74823 RepID=A0AA41UWG1_PAPNU|nr:hypothetical protein [Papaver nudicaule]MCL7028227.1 hypothetical protein [Papaver nudicaule]
MEQKKQRPRAVFMAFGTKGDVYPIAAIAAAFASDQPHYHAILITHSAHQGAKNNAHFPRRRSLLEKSIDDNA